MNVMITISRGGTARNLLKNTFFKELKKNFDQVFIVTPANNDERFISEFGAENVTFLPMLPSENTLLRLLIHKVNKYIIYNKTTEKLIRYDTVGDSLEPPSKVKYVVIKSLFYPLSKVQFVRKFLRWLDYLLLQKDMVRQYTSMILAHEPSVIFSTSMGEDSESALLKAARRLKVPSVAMPKSWDNPSKLYFRAKADTVVVWSHFMKKQMQTLQDYHPSQIAITGVPQFDYYSDNALIESREDFCASLGLDPNKKIIFFGSEGKYVPTDPDVAGVIADLIDQDAFKQPAQLLIRPHFAHKDDHLKFKDYFDRPNVVVDRQNNPSSNFRDRWDYSDKQMNHFLNSLYHSDVVINTCSTLTLDGAAMGKPVILINFDGPTPKPFHRSVKRWYLTDYFTEILSVKAAQVVESEEQLKKSD